MEAIKIPSQTFEGLKAEKQGQIRQALLAEFSTHSLDQAQVARIVKTANISRGSFYKYFTDIEDAYTYLFGYAMGAIHSQKVQRHQLQTASEYVDQVKDFVDQAHQSPYYRLLCKHYLVNEQLLQVKSGGKLRPVGDLEWGVMILVHETIKVCLLNPAEREHSLRRLAKLLTPLLKGEN